MRINYVFCKLLGGLLMGKMKSHFIIIKREIIWGEGREKGIYFFRHMLHPSDLGHPYEFPYEVVITGGAVGGLLDAGVESVFYFSLLGFDLRGDEDTARGEAHFNNRIISEL